MLYTKSYQSLCRERISMLAGLKVPSLACKCVFYRPEHNAKGGMGGEGMELNFEGLEIQKWNMPTDRAQRVDDKNGVICLVIMYTPGVMVIKMSKMAHLLMPAKTQSQCLDKMFTCIWKILFSSIRKCYGLLDSELLLARYQPLRIQSFVIFFVICLLTEQFLWYV